MLYSTDDSLSGSTSCLGSMRNVNGVVSGTTVTKQRLVISSLRVNGSISSTTFPFLRCSFINPGILKGKRRVIFWRLLGCHTREILLEIEVAEHARPFQRYQNNRFASSRTIEQDQYNSRIVLRSFCPLQQKGNNT